MKSITVLFQNISKKIKKHRERQAFLNMKPEEAIKGLEMNTAYKVKLLRCTVKELLEMKDDALLRALQHQTRVDNLFVFLQIEINKRELNIDIKSYPAFKNFEMTRKDKVEYIKENLIN